MKIVHPIKAKNNKQYQCWTVDKISVASDACEILRVGDEGGAMNNRPRDGRFAYVFVVTFKGLSRSLCSATTRGCWTVQFGLVVPLLIILLMSLWLHTT